MKYDMRALGQKFLDFEQIASPDATIEDFFDHVGIREEDRTDMMLSQIVVAATRLAMAEQETRH